MAETLQGHLFSCRPTLGTKPKSLKKKCAVCRSKLCSSWSKPVCCSCISGLVNDDPVASCQKILTSVNDELKSTFSSFKTLIDKFQDPTEGQSSNRRASVSSRVVPIPIPSICASTRTRANTPDTKIEYFFFFFCDIERCIEGACNGS